MVSVVNTAPARRVAFTEPVRRQVIERAAAFIRQRYRMDAQAAQQLMALPVRWRRGCGRSAFYRQACHGYDGPHILLRVPPGAQARWHTYRRVRARWATPPGGVELPIDVLMTVVLVHEYTHAVQHGICGTPARRYSEVETTENELEFVRQYAPEAYARLVPVDGAGGPAPRRNTRRVVRPAPPRPTGARAVALQLLRRIWVRYQLARAT